MAWQWFLLEQDISSINLQLRVNLCMDIGNTKAKMAVFNAQGRIEEYSVSANPGIRSVRQLWKKFKITGGIISSTRHLDEKFLQKVNALFPCLILSEKTDVPIQSEYETPSTLGKDRLAAVVAADAHYKGKSVLVIDIGTCITYDIISEGIYRGGNISPGAYLKIKAMHRYTDKLPLVEMVVNDDIMGKSTVKALQNGAFYGTKGEIDSFIRVFNKRLGKLKVILTGGDASLFAEVLDHKVIVRPHLVLEGLNEIINYNAA